MGIKAILPPITPSKTFPDCPPPSRRPPEINVSSIFQCTRNACRSRSATPEKWALAGSVRNLEVLRRRLFTRPREEGQRRPRQVGRQCEEACRKRATHERKRAGEGERETPMGAHTVSWTSQEAQERKEGEKGKEKEEAKRKVSVVAHIMLFIRFQQCSSDWHWWNSADSLQWVNI